MKSSEDARLYSSLFIDDRGWLTDQILSSPRVRVNRTPELFLAHLNVMDGKTSRKFILSYSHNLFDLQHRMMYQLSPRLKEILLQYVRMITDSHYGELIPWKEARKIFSMKKTATVIDLETGRSFRVQRRAGSRHADVQPLTREDTMTMKEIYNGKWSWQRRAILLEIGGKKIAASMNGMPHGAGAIRDNHFPGHFCIHFDGSSTHRRSYPDPGHRMMVLKAAGLLNQQIYEAGPDELVSLMIQSLNEQDFNVLKRTLDQSRPEQISAIVEQADQIQSIRQVGGGSRTRDNPFNSPDSSEDTPDQSGIRDLIFVNVPVEVDGYTEQGERFKAELDIVVKRDFFYNRWKIEPDSLSELWESIAN
ncbi:MAG: hypothetical protein H0Z33_03045 [Bacillaceae bacterium]|nr:hypothetical protein [Bacillaceae bacterium]